MPNKKNISLLDNLKQKIKDSKSVAVLEYQGLKVNSLNDLRLKIKENEAEAIVAKNTLMQLALKEEGYKDNVSEHFKGPTAVVFSYKDPISSLKPIFDFAKDNELPKFKFAFIEGQFTSAQQLKAISELPSKEQLLAKIVGSLKSPLSGFVNVLGGSQRKFVTVLSKIAESK